MSADHHDHDNQNVMINMEEHETSIYDKRAAALTAILRIKGFIAMDEMRRATEELDTPEAPYFENRIHALTNLMVEKGYIGVGDVAARTDVLDEPELTEYEAEVVSFCQILDAKKIVCFEELQRQVEDEENYAPAGGAKVVARAWRDSAFKERLIDNAKSAVQELGIGVEDYVDVRAVENTNLVHYAVVCTLCSCYPRSILGQQPTWYKSLAYRTRLVRNPRSVLKEMGLDLDPKLEVRIIDTTAEIRYLVIPRRPEGTEGMREEELAGLVTRDSMIGTGNPLCP